MAGNRTPYTSVQDRRLHLEANARNIGDRPGITRHLAELDQDFQNDERLERVKARRGPIVSGQIRFLKKKKGKGER